MQHQPGRIFAGFGPFAPCHNRIRIAVKGMYSRARIQQRTRVAACTKSGIDDHIAWLRIERCNHFGQQDGDMGSPRAGHLRFALASLSASRLLHTALSARNLSSCFISTAGFQIVKNGPAPRKNSVSSICPSLLR